jgi:hypothetical protein
VSVLGKWLKIGLQDSDRFNELKKLLDDIKSTSEVTPEHLKKARELVGNIDRVLLWLQSLADAGYSLGIPEIIRTLFEHDLSKGAPTAVLKRWIGFYNTIPIVKDNFPYDVIVSFLEKKPVGALPFITEDSFIQFIKSLPRGQRMALYDSLQNYLIDQLNIIKETGSISEDLKKVLRDFLEKVGEPIYTTLGHLLGMSEGSSLLFKPRPVEESSEHDLLFGLLSDLRDIIPDIYQNIETEILGSPGEGTGWDVGPFAGQLHKLRQSLENQSRQLSKVEQTGTPEEVQKEIQQTDSVLTTTINDLRSLAEHYPGIHFRGYLQSATDILEEARRPSTVLEKLQKIDQAISYITDTLNLAKHYHKQVRSASPDLSPVMSIALRRLIAIRAVLNAFDAVLDRTDLPSNVKENIRRAYRGPYRGKVVNIARQVVPTIAVKLIVRKAYDPSLKESAHFVTMIVEYAGQSFSATYNVLDRKSFINAYKTIASDLAKIIARPGTDLERDIRTAIAEIAGSFGVSEVPFGAEKPKSKTVPTKEVFEREKYLWREYVPTSVTLHRRIQVPRSYGMFYIPFLRTVYEIADVFNEIDRVSSVINNVRWLENVLRTLRDAADSLYNWVKTNLSGSTELIDKNIRPHYEKLGSSVDAALLSLGTKTMYAVEKAEKEIKSVIIPAADALVSNVSALIAGTKKGPDFDNVVTVVAPFIDAINRAIRDLRGTAFQYPKGTRGTQFLIGSLPILYRPSPEDFSRMTADDFARTVSDEIDRDPEKVVDIYEKTVEGIDAGIDEAARQKERAEESGLDDLASRLDQIINDLSKRKQDLEEKYEKAKAEIEKQEYAEEYEKVRQEMEEGVEKEEKPEVEIPETMEAEVVSTAESSGPDEPFAKPEITEKILGGLEHVGLWD